MSQGRLDSLLKLYDADRADADLPYMVAMEHAKAGDLDEALRWLDTTVADHPGHHYAYYQRAQVLHDLGRTEDAKAAIDAGLTRARADRNAKAAGELEELRESFDDE